MAGEPKYIEVKEATQFADVFFADPILRIATRSFLAAAPAAGIVHCKDCTGPDDFCSYGERKILNP